MNIAEIIKNKASISSHILSLLLIVLIIYTLGFFPGHVNDPVVNYGSIASSITMVNQGIFSSSYYNNSGFEIGVPFVSNFPTHYLSAIIAKMTGNTFYSYRMSGAIIICLSFISSVLLLIYLGSNRFIAIVMTFSYLSLPMIFDSARYGSLMYGFMLFPFFILCDYYIFFKKIKNENNFIKIFMLFIAYCSVKSFSLFMNGYAFVMYSFFSLFVFIPYCLESYKNRRYFLFSDAIFFIFAHLVAVFLYKLYIPVVGGYVTMPLDFFRAQGVDLVTLVSPGNNLFWADFFNVGREWNGLAFFGDGSNVRSNYLGFSLVVSFLLFLFFIKKSFLIKSFIFAGIFALILSLGPSIKYNNQQNITDESIESVSYLMDDSQPVFNLPYGFIFNKVPGLKTMRAVYRWITVFMFLLIITGSLLLTHAWRSGKKAITFLALSVIVIEMLPNYPRYKDSYENYNTQFTKFNEDVISSLGTFVSEYDKVFFMTSTQENDFLANYIASSLNLYSYNVGGDKNMRFVMPTWPPVIQSLRVLDDVNVNIVKAFSLSKVDKIIVPYFNLRWHTYRWPPSESERIKYRDDILSKFSIPDEHFIFQDLKWFGVISSSSLE